MGDVNNAAPDSFWESGSSLEPHVCEVCYHNYNEKTRIPKVLGCGHTYCLRCVREMFTHGASILTCPVCRTATRSTLDRVPTNFQLLLVIKNQKLLCTEKEEEEEAAPKPTSNVIPGLSLQVVMDEPIDESVLTTAKFFEDEVAKLKKQLQELGLNPSRCFPNTSYIFGTMPADEQSTLAAISEGVHKLHTTYNGVCYLLKKARIQKQLIAEQIEAGTAKKLPNGGVDLNPRRPNGEPISEAYLLNPPVGNVLDTIYDDDDDDDPWDDVDSYSGQSPFDAEDHLVDNFRHMMFDPVYAPSWYEDEPTGSVGIFNNSISAFSHLQPDLFAPAIPEANRCDICNCPVPPGRQQTEQHEAGRRHRTNVERRNNGLPPETPPPRPQRTAARGRRRGTRNGPVHMPPIQRQPFPQQHTQWVGYIPRNVSPPPNDDYFSWHY